MWHRLAATSAVFLALVSGCKTLHTGDGKTQQTAVAAWSDFLFVKKNGQPEPAPPELIARTLKDVGIDAGVDDAGLRIAPEDRERAERALLTDSRLKGSGIFVFVLVDAGSGRETSTAIEFALPTTRPTTAPSTMPTSQPD